MVNAPSSFRGYAGEVVGEIIKMRCLLSVAMVLVTSIAVGLTVRISGIFGTILSLWAGALLIGAFAVPASLGDFSRGITSPKLERGECWFFAIRLLAIYAVWGVPLAVIIYKTGMHLSVFDDSAFGFPVLGLGARAIWAIILLLFLCSLPLLSAIVAAGTDSLVGAISPKAWKWIFLARGADLPCFFVSFYGGLVLFGMYYAVPLIVLATFVIKASPGTAIFLTVWIPMFPSLVAPCLLGKLAGVFVYGEDAVDQIEEDTGPIVPKVTRKAPPVAAAEKVEAPTGGTPGAAPDTGIKTPTLSALQGDPPALLIKSIRDKLGQVQDVAVAHLVEVTAGGQSRPELTLVVAFQPDAKLASRQAVTKALTAEVKILFPTPEQEARATALGLRIYGTIPPRS